MTRRKKLGAGLIFATGFLSVRSILLCKKQLIVSMTKVADSAIVASILSVLYRVIHGDEHGDNTWWLVPIMAVT